MPFQHGEQVALGAPDVHAWTTGRGDGSFGLVTSEPVVDVMHRWGTLQDVLSSFGVSRLATASQVHGIEVARHDGAWRGWLRLRGVDGHMTTTPGTALAVTIADCTPVFIAHPRGAIAALHAGWRGTAADILSVGCKLFTQAGFPPEECVVHLGPSICGSCYEVGPEVLSAVTGRPAHAKGLLDVRAVLMEQAHRLGIRTITVSKSCTRCHNDRFFSHRAGDSGRQLGVVALGATQ
jgi:YfiH family protein